MLGFILAQLFLDPLAEAHEFPAEIWREAFIAERRNFQAIDQANFQCLADVKHYESEAYRIAAIANKCRGDLLKSTKTINQLRAKLKKNNKSSKR